MKLNIKNVSKTYSNGVQALKNVNLEISNGMFGLLGPNGAGKSTLMRTIATLQEPDSGEITFNTIDVQKQKDELRRYLGYLPQEFGIYPKVSSEVLLYHLAILKGVTNQKERKELIDVILHKTNLYNDRKKALGGFSGGMKQRFGIAQALLNNPQLIIVDEPTAGLDPAERNRFLNFLGELGENTIVILSTHIVEDVSELCTDMAIMDEGAILYTGKPSNAVQDLDGKVWKKAISKDQIEAYKMEFEVLYETMLGGKPILHVLSDKHPGVGFEQAEANLKAVYFSKINKLIESPKLEILSN